MKEEDKKKKEERKRKINLKIWILPAVLFVLLVVVVLKTGFLSLVLIGLSAYYIYISQVVGKKRGGEVVKDFLVFGLWFIIFWWGLCLNLLIPTLKESPLAGSFPSWTYLLVKICFFFLTFRMATEGIRITKRKIEDGEKIETGEDWNLSLIRITSEMIAIFLLFPVTLIYVCTSLGIRWWHLMSGPSGKVLLGTGLAWCGVVYILPGTYKFTQRLLKVATVVVLLLLIFVSCWVNGQKAGFPFGVGKSWDPGKESVFEYRARMKKMEPEVEAKKKAERKEIIIFRSAPQVVPVLPGMRVNLEHFQKEYPKMLVVNEKKKILSKRKTPEHYYNSSGEIRYLYLYESIK